MLQVLATISPLFFIIFGAAGLQHIGVITYDWQKVLNKFALHVALPALILVSIARMEFSLARDLPIIVANSAVLLSSYVVAIGIGKVFRLRAVAFRTLFICLAFGNVAYMGIPILEQLYGPDVLPSVSLIVSVYIFWVFTIGVGYLEYNAHKRTKKAVFVNVVKKLCSDTLLISVAIGLVFSLFRIPFPSVIAQGLDMVASSVTPVVLVVIGLFMGYSEKGTVRDWIPVVGFVAVTLVLLPALVFLGVKLLNYDPVVFKLTILEAAMPLAITPFALADEYGLDKSFIARSIVLSIVFSIVTIPFWVSVL
jgi:predicted permease